MVSGASSAWMSGTIPTTALDQIFSPVTGAGLSLFRSRITPYGGSTENLMMQQAGAYGVRAWSTPWTPPREFKTNHDNNNGGSLDPAHYQDYANDLANYVQDITRQGVPLYAVSIQNEPNWTADYESARWDASQFAAFLPYVGQTFAARGITTKIMLPEQLNWDFSLANTIMSNPTLAQYVGILAAHNYGETSTSWKPASNANGKPVWETEVSSSVTRNGVGHGHRHGRRHLPSDVAGQCQRLSLLVAQFHWRQCTDQQLGPDQAAVGHGAIQQVCTARLGPDWRDRRWRTRYHDVQRSCFGQVCDRGREQKHDQLGNRKFHAQRRHGDQRHAVHHLGHR